MSTPPLEEPTNTAQGFDETEVYPPLCLTCDNFKSEGKGLTPECMEGINPLRCVESVTTRYMPRGGSKERL